jgi:hypothetical protein
MASRVSAAKLKVSKKDLAAPRIAPRIDRRSVRGGLAPPPRRRASEKIAKGAREVRLISKAAGQGDLAKFAGPSDHEPFRAFDALAGHEARERYAKGQSKAP